MHRKRGYSGATMPIISDVAMSLGLEEGLRLESTLSPAVVFSKDFEEGITAFAEKRKPKFEGR